MTDTKQQPRSKDKTKKIVSLTIDPVLISRVDAYAAERGISRSAAIETAITGLLALNPNTAFTVADNSLVQTDDCMFAAPQLGSAIFY